MMADLATIRNALFASGQSTMPHGASMSRSPSSRPPGEPFRAEASDGPGAQVGCAERIAPPATPSIRARASSVRSTISLKHQRR